MDKDYAKIIGAHGLRRNRDFYPTPPECTQALINFLENEGITIGRVWECASGDGHIVRVLEQNRYDVIASDIITGTDFLSAKIPEGGADFIITNPPFVLAEQFIRKAMSFNIPFAFLLKSQFWHAGKRYPLFVERPPSYVLPLTWRPDFCGGGNSMIDCIWTVWLLREGPTIYKPLQKA